MSTRPVVFVHPRGTYKSSTFYFRGDDVLKEPEYLIKEKQDLELQLKQVTKELEKEKKIYDQTNEELKKRDEFTVSLASALGSESEATAKNAGLRHQLAELTTKIEGTERAISKFKSQQQQPVITAYQKEKAYYETEIEDLRIHILDGMEDIKDGKEALGRVVCSDEFATANIATGLLHAKKSYYSYLRKELTGKINQINSTSSSGLLKGPQPKLPVEIENLIARKQKLNTQKAALERECKRKTLTGRDTAIALVNQIARMNEILVALGGEKLETQELKDKYANMDFTQPCDRTQEEEEEELEAKERNVQKVEKEDDHESTSEDEKSKNKEKQESPKHSDNEEKHSDSSSDDEKENRPKSEHKSREASREQSPPHSPHEEHISDYNYEKPKEEEDGFDKEHENTDLIIKDYDQDMDSDKTNPKDDTDDDDHNI